MMFEARAKMVLFALNCRFQPVLGEGIGMFCIALSEVFDMVMDSTGITLETADYKETT